MDTITLAGGCFWCVEAVYRELKGVRSAVSGYCNGRLPNPTYQQVCGGDTGHAEAVRVTFDPAVIPLQDVLDIFWHTHDPTTLNRQGNDVGTQYRSAIFYEDERQRAAAEASMARAQSGFPSPIVTEITKLDRFYPAEDYHQDFFRLNPTQSYCRAVISPKMSKFRKSYADRLQNP